MSLTAPRRSFTVKGKGSLVAEQEEAAAAARAGGVQSGSGSSGVGVGLPFSQFIS